MDTVINLHTKRTKGVSYQRCSQHAEAQNLHKVPDKCSKGTLPSLMMLWHASPMHAAAGIPSKALLQSVMGYKCTAAEAGPVTALSLERKGPRSSPGLPYSQASGYDSSSFRTSC